jgi:hypothetical protein
MLAEYAGKVDREKLEQLSKAFHRSKSSVPTRSGTGHAFRLDESCWLLRLVASSEHTASWASAVHTLSCQL